MAAPNIVDVGTITAKFFGDELTTSAQDMLENTAASGKVYKVTWLRVTNKDGTSDATVTVTLVDASPSQSVLLAYQINVPAGAAIDIIDKASELFLEEGDKITALASANGDLDLAGTYLELS